jgi:exosome complex RNA-binding protein Rrp42 (RNase PH superfamily)
MVYIYVSSNIVATIHINHLKFQAGVFCIIEKKMCVLVNCDVLVCEARGNSSSLSFSTIFAITTYNMVYFRII